MTKIDVFSGFLGAGKTTLIKKLIKEAYCGEKLVLIENEFGEIGVDGGFMKEAGIQINELNSGCICCSLVGDFAKALKKVKEEYDPDRILIEPSGVGKLSDIVKAVERANLSDCKINSLTTVVDANRCKIYMKNFGEFFNDQIENAACIVFSHTDVTAADKLEKTVELVREHNPNATFVTTDLKGLTGEQILSAMEHSSTLADELKKLSEETEEEHEHCHHDHDEDEEHEHCCHHDH
ncbi:MAG: GTP-binding protein, partial [Candidatus Coproplasma sp.]